MIKYVFTFLSFLALSTNPGIAIHTPEEVVSSTKGIVHPSTWPFLKGGDPVEVIMPAATFVTRTRACST